LIVEGEKVSAFFRVTIVMRSAQDSKRGKEGVSSQIPNSPNLLESCNFFFLLPSIFTPKSCIGATISVLKWLELKEKEEGSALHQDGHGLWSYAEDPPQLEGGG